MGLSCPAFIILCTISYPSPIFLNKKTKMSKTKDSEFYSFYKFVLTPENPFIFLLLSFVFSSYRLTPATHRLTPVAY
jgi:hypothetical protein